MKGGAMQEHDDLDTVVNNLTELYRCIEVGSDDPYVCGMKQLIVNPLAWVHAERIARAGRAAQSAEVRPDTAQPSDNRPSVPNDGLCQACGAPVDESGMYPGSAHVG